MCVLENLVTEEQRSHHTILIGLGPQSVGTHCLNPNKSTFMTPPNPMVAVSPTGSYVAPQVTWGQNAMQKLEQGFLWKKEQPWEEARRWGN